MTNQKQAKKDTKQPSHRPTGGQERAEEIVREWGRAWHSVTANTPLMHDLIDRIAAALSEAQEAERICPKCGIRVEHRCEVTGEFRVSGWLEEEP